MFGKSKLRVGILGLGIIGSRIAKNLREAGFPVVVWNRTAKTEPNFLGSPAEVAQASDVIQLFVADPKAVFEVIEAMGESLTSRHTVVCSSTIGREATLKAAEMIKAKGACFLDCPFTGTKGAAEKGQLVYFIGGDDATFAAAKPMLEPVSKAIVRIGEVGQAALVKVLTNVINGAYIEVLIETLAVMKAEGMDPALMTKALEYHGVRSPMIDLKLPKLLDGSFEDTHFSLKHMLKDVHFGLGNAADVKLDLPVTKATAEAMEDGLERGWGDQDFSCILKRYYTPEPPKAPEAPEA